MSRPRSIPSATGGQFDGTSTMRPGVAPIPPTVLPRLRARALKAVARGRVQFGLACGVVLAGLVVVLIALVLVRAGSIAELLIRVHGAGLVGLVGMAWGAALVEQAAVCLSMAHTIERALISGSGAAEITALLVEIDG